MRVAPLAFLVLLGCGGAGGPESQADCPVNQNVLLNLVASLPDGVGSSDRCVGDGFTYLKIHAGLPQGSRRRVIAHELGHAAGLPHAFDNTGCVMDQAVYATPGPLCPEEVAAMASALGTRILDLFPGPGLFDDVVAAADMWSLAVGRPLFAIH